MPGYTGIEELGWYGFPAVRRAFLAVNTGEVNFLGVVSLDASGLESSDACITAFAEQLYDSLITNETRKGEGGS